VLKSLKLLDDKEGLYMNCDQIQQYEHVKFVLVFWYRVGRPEYHRQHRNFYVCMEKGGGVVLDQEGVLREIKSDKGNCKMIIIRLKCN